MESELMSVVDLQKFLAGELSTTDSDPSFHRAFTPLTDGLGLESPKKRETAFQAPPPPPAPEKKAEAPVVPASLKVDSVIGPPQSKEPQAFGEHDDLPPIDPLLAAKRVPVNLFADEEKPKEVAVPLALPPPMPKVSLFRRLQAGLIDQVLVIAIWAVSLVITSQILSRGDDALVPRLLQDLSSAHFLRFAVLEFLAIWLAYFAVCLGAMDMTVGMWVWGLRVGYGEGAHAFKKWVRIVLSLGFVAPVIPSLLLVFRFHGRNLVDGLSGTSLYRV